MTFRLIKDHPKQPIPNWGFIVDDTELSAPTADKLLEKIVAYRESNGQPAGNPEHELALSLVVKYPHLVREVDDAQEAPDPLWSWVNRLWRDLPKKPADIDSIKARLSVCEKCPHARPIPVNEELERRAYLLASGELRLKTQCAHHHWHNGLAINLAEPAPWGRLPAPKECWAPQ